MTEAVVKSALPAGAKAALVGGVAAYLLIKAGSGYGWMLRPPGALPEAEFLGACLRCGLCVRDCPYDTLKLAQITDPREQPEITLQQAT